MSRINIEVEVLKLKEAIAVSENVNASEDEVAAALIIINNFSTKLSTYKYQLDNKLKDINLSKRQPLELVYSNFNGDGVGVIVEEKTHTTVDMVGVHKDAQAVLNVVYSNDIYSQVFTPTVHANKSKVIQLAEKGLLPNANQRVKKVTVEQIKLFDYVKPKDSE